jgi:L-asparagine oxygenase
MAVRRETPWLETPAGEELSVKGYVLRSDTTGDDLEETALELGEPVAARGFDPVRQTLTPTTSEAAAAKSLSADHGLGAFPFHTDAAHHRQPPRWIVMRCAEPGPLIRPTLLADSADFGLDESDWRRVERAVWWVRSGGRGFPVSIARRVDGRRTIRYDRGCMTPADASASRAAELFERALGEVRPVPVEWQRGAMLVVDNHRMLHARAAGGSGDAGIRRLERILVR